MGKELTLDEVKMLVKTVKKYDALLDVVNKFQEIFQKKSIAKLISKKDHKELFDLYNKFIELA